MQNLHALVRRQWQRYLGPEQAVTAELRPFLTAVSDAYVEFDKTRQLVERALAISSGELHAATNELGSVLQIVPDLLFCVSADGQVKGLREGTDVTAHPVLQSLGHSAEKSHVPEARGFWNSLEQARTQRVPSTFEHAHCAADVTTHYEVRLLPFLENDVIGLMRDITARKQAEQDRLVLGKLESTGILAGGIAHDFDNLLTGILLNLDLAQNSGRPTDGTADCLAAIRRNASAAQLLTQQLVTLARDGAPARQPWHLGALLQESVSLALSGSNVRADLAVSADLFEAEVDATQIGQALRNLALNARQAMPEGGVVSVHAGNLVLIAGNAIGLPAGNYIHVRVEDRGVGIPVEILPRIFDPYFTTKTRGEHRGMGLGLTIAQSIVQKHAGAITVDSELGKGSRFSIYLPTTASQTAVAPQPAPAELPRKTPPTIGRALVMDDEQIVRDVCRKVLEHLGYETVTVPDGGAAVEHYARARAEGKAFDVVFLDLTVKGSMGGKEASALVLAHDPAARLVVMSGYSEDEVMRHYQRHGFKAVLTKPFDREGLRRAVNCALEGR